MMDRQKAIKLALEVYGTGFFSKTAQDCLMELIGKVEREVRGDAEPVFNDIDEALEKAYWRFDAMVKGYGEWKLRRQSERDAFKQAVRSIGPFSYVAPETLHESEECECVHLALSKRGVPDKDENGNKYSLLGRVELYASPALSQPANVNTVVVQEHPAPAVVRQLVGALEQLMSIVKIYSRATSNNFALAEMDFAKEALAAAKEAGL